MWCYHSGKLHWAKRPTKHSTEIPRPLMCREKLHDVYSHQKMEWWQIRVSICRREFTSRTFTFLRHNRYFYCGDNNVEMTQNWSPVSHYLVTLKFVAFFPFLRCLKVPRGYALTSRKTWIASWRILAIGTWFVTNVPTIGARSGT